MDETREPHERRERVAEELAKVFHDLVGAWELDSEPELAPFLARAGARAAELEARVELVRALEELGGYARAADVEELAVPTDLGRFRVLGVLGRGGQSRVLLAEDRELERRVALKLVTDARFLTREARDWIKNEGQVVARLSHPGVVRVLDIGDEEGVPYLVMELVEGPSLREVLDALAEASESGAPAPHSERALEAAARLAPLGARCRLGLAIARALAACHAQGVLHRDLKPSNVLLERGRDPKLVDFGLGNRGERERSLTNVTVTFVGTAAYLSPEQVERRQTLAEPASDQFALGIVLYELLTTRNPFARPTESETLAAIAAAAPLGPRQLDPRIPPDLERIVLTALRRAPADRYPSVAALAEDLEAFLDHRAIRARPPSLGRRVTLWVRRRPRPFAAAALVVLALLALGVVRPFWSELRRAQALRSGLETFSGATRRAAAPRDLERAFLGLDQLEGEVRLARAGRFASLLPRVDRDFEAARALLCARAEEAFAAAHAACDRPIEALTLEARRELVPRWVGVRTLARLRCGPSEALLHRVGTLRLASRAGRGELLRFVGVTGEGPEIEAVEDASQDELLPYRARWLDAGGGLVAERDLVCDPGAPPRVIEPREPDASWLARLVEVTLPAGPTTTNPTGRLLVSPRVVRYAELDSAAEGPAVVALTTAMEHAAARGMRLPTLGELHALLESGALEEDPDASGEYCLAASPIVLTYPTEKTPRLVQRVIDYVDRRQASCGFRLVCDPRLAR